jgi:hypothetical protein
MPTTPRNAPCPCGSGRKHKLCCGTTRDQERARHRAIEELFGLPFRFPLLRPDSDDFENWLRAHRAEPPTRELIETAVNVLSAAECGRIAGSYAAWFPQEWSLLRADVADEATVETVTLLGAIAASLAERPHPGSFVLGLLEDDPDVADPAEVLALCLEATDLWSVEESAIADCAIAAISDELDEDEYARCWDAALERAAAHLLSGRHRRRLLVLANRLRHELPFEGFPRTSRAVDQACAALERNRHLHLRVSSMLLGDTLGPFGWRQSALAA